jgi:Phosphatidylserine synthase
MKKLKSIGKNKEDLLRNKISKHTFYLLPNFITTAALFSGFYSIVQAMNGKYELAAIAIFIAIIMDGLDGRIARLTILKVLLEPNTIVCPTWCHLA